MGTDGGKIVLTLVTVNFHTSPHGERLHGVGEGSTKSLRVYASHASFAGMSVIISCDKASPSPKCTLGLAVSCEGGEVDERPTFAPLVTKAHSSPSPLYMCGMMPSSFGLGITR